MPGSRFGVFVMIAGWVAMPDGWALCAAGASGASLHAMFRDRPRIWLYGLEIVHGALMALFVVPAICELWIDDAHGSVARGVAFCVGVGGPSVVEILVRAIDANGDSVANRLIRRVTGVQHSRASRQRARHE